MRPEFVPFVSLRERDSGGGIGEAMEYPSGALTSQSSAVLLIHGYNNGVKDATAAYKRFVTLQESLGRVNAHVVAVYWPGDNWEGPLFYMQALKRVPEIAERLARAIHRAARARAFFRLSIIAHSLGCRLTLETIAQLQTILNAEPVPGFVLERVVFMAGAVPTFALEPDSKKPRPLRGALQFFRGALNMFSEADKVLHFAFPPGQTAAGGGLFPTALGRRQWVAGSDVYPPMRQERNQGADHSDYWGGNSKNTASINQAARIARSFIDLGGAPAREIAARTTASAATLPARSTIDARVVAAR